MFGFFKKKKPATSLPPKPTSFDSHLAEKPQRLPKVATCICVVEADLICRPLSAMEEPIIAAHCEKLLQLALGEERTVIRLVKFEWATCTDIVEVFRRAQDRWERDHSRFG